MDKNIQAMPLGRGDVVSPYTVQSTDDVIEFTDDGAVTCTFAGGTTSLTTVMAGSRYSIGNGIITISFDSTFSIG